MADEGKGIAMVILGIVAIVAVIGLVLMFTRPGAPEGRFTWSQPPSLKPTAPGHATATAFCEPRCAALYGGPGAYGYDNCMFSCTLQPQLVG